jgi:hypothetical protein
VAIDELSPSNMHHTPLDQRTHLTQGVYFDTLLDAQFAMRNDLITSFSNEFSGYNPLSTLSSCRTVFIDRSLINTKDEVQERHDYHK